MSDDITTPPGAGVLDPAVPPEDEAPQGRSVVDVVRDRHKNKVRHLDRPIPRWDNDVIVRYGRVPKHAMLAATRGRKTAAASNADMLEAACIEIFVLDDDGDLRPVSDGDGQPGPVRFDGRLADLFELKGQTPRDFVLRMYADEVAVGRDAQRVFAWQTGEDLEDFGPEEVEDEVGEEDAAT